MIKLFKNISTDIKKNFENIIEGDDLKLDFNNIIDHSVKYKKFEEILFILNADLKQIREFIISVNFNIHIDVLELLDLIKNIFVESEKRENLIKFINENLNK